MTREEAIQILADLTDNLFLHTWEKQNKALHMAIEALSEPSGDLISRVDAIKAVWNAYADAINIGDSGEEIVSDIDIILSALPSADAEGSLKAIKRQIDEHWYLDEPSAEATCATCADRALCIMSAPDGHWKACKDYRPLAEPKTGKWVKIIDEETPNLTKWHYECDQCGAGRWEEGQRYCQNCGARMIREDGEV